MYSYFESINFFFSKNIYIEYVAGRLTGKIEWDRGKLMNAWSCRAITTCMYHVPFVLREAKETIRRVLRLGTFFQKKKNTGDTRKKKPYSVGTVSKNRLMVGGRFLDVDS